MILILMGNADAYFLFTKSMDFASMTQTADRLKKLEIKLCATFAMWLNYTSLTRIRSVCAKRDLKMIMVTVNKFVVMDSSFQANVMMVTVTMAMDALLHAVFNLTSSAIILRKVFPSVNLTN
jgi:hypothetical protein